MLRLSGKGSICQMVILHNYEAFLINSFGVFKYELKLIITSFAIITLPLGGEKES